MISPGARVLSALLALVIGCSLPDDPLRHQCVVDDHCTAGRFCVAGQCVTTRPAPDAAADGAAAEDAAADTAADMETASPPDAAVDAALDGEPVARCGDGRREGREECDDGNQLEGDLCDNQCHWTHPPQLRAGRDHTCLLTGDRHPVCWGQNFGLGQLPATVRAIGPTEEGICWAGDDGAIGCSLPTLNWGSPGFFTPVGAYSDLSFRNSQGCAISAASGALTCWGSPYPEGPTPPGKFLELALGANHACARREDATVTCWGRDDSGEARAPAGRFARLAVGPARSCGLRESGELACWGAVTLNATDRYRSVTVGEDRICAVARGGAVACWSPGGGPLPAPSGDFMEVAAGSAHACALRFDGGVTCWGANDLLQASLPRGPYQDVAMVGPAGCATKTNGELICWGFLGETFGNFPTVPPGKFQSVSFASTFACALRDDGMPVCWGVDYPSEVPPLGTFRQLAVPWALRTDGTVVNWYRLVPAPSGFFTRIAANNLYACGLRTDGKLVCWNESGSPLPVTFTGSYTGLAFEYPLICGLRTDGAVDCADCARDMPGDPIVCKTDPRRPAANGPFRKIGWYINCMCGLPADGSPVCWGAGDVLDTTCMPPSTDRTQVVDFWAGCATNARGALYCDASLRTVDLDEP